MVVIPGRRWPGRIAGSRGARPTIRARRILLPELAVGGRSLILKILSGILGVAGLAWLVLLFSSRAILVGERIEDATLHQQLVCSYFTGSGTMKKEYWYSKSGRFGRAACPRWETVRPAE